MISKNIYSLVILHQIIAYMNITCMNIFNEYQYLRTHHVRWWTRMKTRGCQMMEIPNFIIIL